MAWLVIISFLSIGLILLIVEVVFIPGTTVVGILGIIFSIVGVIVCYQNFGSTIGFYVMLGTLLSTGVALYFSFKSDAWSSFALKSAIKSKVNQGIADQLRVGDLGETQSALRPFGKAQFGDLVIEVRSIGAYAEPRTKIKIIQIEGNQIIVDVIA